MPPHLGGEEGELMWAPRGSRDWRGVWATPGRLWCRLAHRGLWKVWTTTHTRGTSRVFYRCRMCWREWRDRRSSHVKPLMR